MTASSEPPRIVIVYRAYGEVTRAKQRAGVEHLSPDFETEAEAVAFGETQLRSGDWYQFSVREIHKASAR